MQINRIKYVDIVKLCEYFLTQSEMLSLTVRLVMKVVNKFQKCSTSVKSCSSQMVHC